MLVEYPVNAAIGTSGIALRADSILVFKSVIYLEIASRVVFAFSISTMCALISASFEGALARASWTKINSLRAVTNSAAIFADSVSISDFSDVT